MALKTLKSKLPMLNASRVKVLDTKAGSTERVYGRAWMTTRRAVLLRDGYACCDCGRVHASNQIDHDTPLEQGGSNEQANLKVRCVECHKKKSATEAKQRAGR